jgi:hypothetical protein
MNEIISRCGYCGDVIDYCQGHGEDERAEFGFEIDSDEYEKRREVFEADARFDEIAAAAPWRTRHRCRSLPGDFNELTRDDDGYRADIDAGLV